MKRSSPSYDGYVSIFALVVFIMIIASCLYYAICLRSQLLIIENLEEIRDNVKKEYAVLLSFDALLKEYEPEILYDEEGEEIGVSDEIVIDDYWVDGIYVDVLSTGNYFVLSYEDVRFRVYGDLEGISSYELY